MIVIGIKPTVDFAFKRLFGNPEHPRITIHFLNAVLGPSLRIRSVEFCNPILDKETEDDKLSILDILAQDDRGRLINLEIQTTVPAGLNQRLTYYVSSLSSGKFREGVVNKVLNPAISICVLIQPMYAKDPRLHLDFRLRETSEQRQLYEARLKFQFDEAARMEGALNQVLSQGREEGLNEGLKQGREEGRARARVEGALVGQIMLLQEQLGVAEFTQNELINFSEAQLSEMAAEFKRRLKNRSV